MRYIEQAKQPDLSNTDIGICPIPTGFMVVFEHDCKYMQGVVVLNTEEQKVLYSVLKKLALNKEP